MRLRVVRGESDREQLELELTVAEWADSLSTPSSGASSRPSRSRPPSSSASSFLPTRALADRCSRMRIFAPNETVAKSRFWYYLRQLKKVKKANGEIVGLNVVRSDDSEGSRRS